MTQDIYQTVNDYVIKNPDLNYTEIADLILEDDAISKSHRTIRRYVAEVKNEENSRDLQVSDPSAVTLTTVGSSSADVAFVDITTDVVELSEELGEDDDPDIVKESKQPKILLLDIETARMIVGVWRFGKQYVGPSNVIQDWFILGWAAKWLFEATTMSEFVTPQEAKDRDDKRILHNLWHLMNEADVIIAHNGNKFDLPKINTRFILNGFDPPMPYLSVDTYRVASKHFGFSSNGLSYLGKLLLRREKMDTNYQLWIDCEAGDQTALTFMETYCIDDTGLLEEVYLEVRAWIKSHPNLGVLMNATEQTCPNCGGTDFDEEGGYYTTPQNQYEAVRCSDCGAVNRKKKSLVSKEQRENNLVPAAR